MFLGGLIIFVSMAIALAGTQRALEDRYCMTDCCDPTSMDWETNGKCWDCRGTGHTHSIADNGKIL